MKTFYVNARYLIVPLMTIATIFGIFLGNNFVWLGVILFGFNTIIDTLTKDIHLRADFDEDGNSFGIKKFQYAVMYLMLPTFIVLQIILAWRLFHYTSAYPIEVLSSFGITYQSGISGINLIGATLSAGLWAGLGIIYGHELSHNRKEGFFISRLIMSLSGASHFTYAHVYNHHLDLGHEDDPATAPRGRNVYHHAWLSHVGQSKYSFDLERDKLKKQKKSFFSLSNKWIIGYLYSLPSIILFVYSGDLEVLGVAVSLLFYAAIFQIPDGIGMGSLGALRGYKDTFAPMVFLIISYWIFAIPFGYFLTNYGIANPLGAEGMWISMILGLLIFSMFIFNRLRIVSSKYI